MFTDKRHAHDWALTRADISALMMVIDTNVRSTRVIDPTLSGPQKLKGPDILETCQTLRKD